MFRYDFLESLLFGGFNPPMKMVEIDPYSGRGSLDFEMVYCVDKCDYRWITFTNEHSCIAHFNQSDVRFADLSGLNLTCCTFYHCDLTGVDFYGCDFRRVEMSNCILDFEQLRGVIYGVSDDSDHRTSINGRMLGEILRSLP